MKTDSAYGPLYPKEIILLKKEIRRQLFPSAALALLLFLFAFIYCIFNKNFGWLFLIFSLVAAAAGIITFYLLSRKLSKDLKQGISLCIPASVEEKKYQLSYEAGSATIPVNLFSIFSIKEVASREMKELHWYSLIVNGEEIPVIKEEFEHTEKGRQVIIRKAPNTGLLLGVVFTYF